MSRDEGNYIVQRSVSVREGGGAGSTQGQTTGAEGTWCKGYFEGRGWVKQGQGEGHENNLERFIAVGVGQGQGQGQGRGEGSMAKVRPGLCVLPPQTRSILEPRQGRGQGKRRS